MTDFFTEGPIDPRIYKELATDMWRETVSYLPIRDVLKLPGLCKYFNEEIVWHPHSGRLLWGEMGRGTIDTRMFSDLNNRLCRTALIRACVRGAPLSHVTALLVGGANVNAVDSQSQTALLCASWRGYEGIVRLLLEANADPNIAMDGGSTPLMWAIDNGHTAVVSALIKGGANINHIANNGKTALMWTIARNRVDVVKILVNARADINFINNDGETTLDMARRYGHRDIISILKEAQK